MKSLAEALLPQRQPPSFTKKKSGLGNWYIRKSRPSNVACPARTSRYCGARRCSCSDIPVLSVPLTTYTTFHCTIAVHTQDRSSPVYSSSISQGQSHVVLLPTHWQQHHHRWLRVCVENYPEEGERE
ncbi:hypothetical protein M378DRAFT_537041 [Amanita muscaria Koide BX008]|uniref:Uncharacterized protein n=1 Tax=Amanita muscaria (strain Koide BX008) TaxID=946122 RepID=A0A0C2X951_AMAMK|nr:hypothetical protein M378DRAFT_537041 [Amanita muscaria Koide BX008]